jgi:hypothetical protein
MGGQGTAVDQSTDCFGGKAQVLGDLGDREQPRQKRVALFNIPDLQLDGGCGHQCPDRLGGRLLRESMGYDQRCKATSVPRMRLLHHALDARAKR